MNETTTIMMNDATPSDAPEYLQKCDSWSQWLNDHDPINDKFEKEGISNSELYSLGFCKDVKSYQ